MMPAPVIVVSGLPRSGTSMMMRMLEAGGVPVIADGLRKADTDNPGGYYEYEPVKLLKKDASWLDRAAGRAVKIIYLLLRDLPRSHRYDVIFMRRDVEEVVASQDQMLRRSGAPAAEEESRRLVALFRQEVAAAEAWLAAQPNFRVLYIDYRQAIDHPGSVCSAICNFLGDHSPAAALDEARMSAVISADLYRQRRTQPLPQ
jgi:hypothetical protein